MNAAHPVTTHMLSGLYTDTSPSVGTSKIRTVVAGNHRRLFNTVGVVHQDESYPSAVVSRPHAQYTRRRAAHAGWVVCLSSPAGGNPKLWHLPNGKFCSLCLHASSARDPNFYVAPLKRVRGPQILVRAPILPSHHLHSPFPPPLNQHFFQHNTFLMFLSRRTIPSFKINNSRRNSFTMPDYHRSTRREDFGPYYRSSQPAQDLMVC
jgi:hypothetical protein